MSLRMQIKQDFITAFKAREKQKADALRNIESAVKDVEIDTRKELSDEEVVRILKKEMKKRNDSIEMYRKAGREELASSEEFEVGIIQGYLPEEMGEDEVNKIIDEVKVELGQGANFGQVMGLVMKKVGGNADGKMVALLVKAKMS